MNPEKAIEAIKDNYPPSNYTILREALDLSMSVLEKQIPKKVIKSPYNVKFCPVCKGSVWQNRDESKYCFRCGQKIYWGDL